VSIRTQIIALSVGAAGVLVGAIALLVILDTRSRIDDLGARLESNPARVEGANIEDAIRENNAALRRDLAEEINDLHAYVRTKFGQIGDDLEVISVPLLAAGVRLEGTQNSQVGSQEGLRRNIASLEAATLGLRGQVQNLYRELSQTAIGPDRACGLVSDRHEEAERTLQRLAANGINSAVVLAGIHLLRLEVLALNLNCPFAWAVIMNE
jgi:hypothetical protein